MDKDTALAQIEEYRGGIDAIDRELVALLNKRAGLSLAIRELKPAAGMQLFDAAREDAIYDKVCGFSEKILYDEGLREIYATLLKVMKENPAK